jgi:hypothetical protein
MERVMTAPLAILLELDAIGIILLVLLGRVITTLAFRARQGDVRTHVSSYLHVAPWGTLLKNQA